jgi:hypothetical protein
MKRVKSSLGAALPVVSSIVKTIAKPKLSLSEAAAKRLDNKLFWFGRYSIGGGEFVQFRNDTSARKLSPLLGLNLGRYSKATNTYRILP